MNSPWHEIRFRLDHRWTRMHMSAYLDSELQTQLAARLEHHTAECPQCRAVLSQLRRMLVLLEAVPVPLPAVDGTAIATAVIQRLNAPATD
jgi:predicted anti-sigma-YlaC factor YlaD